jgi:phage terminase large subunit-like protein
MESLDSVRSQELRDELYNWYKSELVPAGAENARYIFIGTPLHVDSLFSRLSSEINSGTMSGIVSVTPILDNESDPTWLARYPTNESVLEERFKKGLPEHIWRVEYMLETIVSEDQIIKPEYIHYYDPIFPREGIHVKTYISVDPAATANPSSNHSGIIIFSIWEKGGIRKVYIDKIYKEKLDHEKLVVFLISLARSIKDKEPVTVYVEDVGFQSMIVSALKKETIKAETFSVKGRSKEERLIESSFPIESGMILLPKTGAEELLKQLFQFDPNKNNDLVDAFTQGILISQKQLSHGFLEIMYQDRDKLEPRDFVRPRSMADWVNAAKSGYFA